LLAALERLEKQVWEKFKNKDKAGYPIVTDDYTAVAADGKGERDLKGTLDSFKDITIGKLCAEDFRLTMLGPSAAAASLQLRPQNTALEPNNSPADWQLAISG